MPDLQNFKITRGGNLSVTIPSYTIECKVVESKPNGAVLSDRTGVNSIQFPAVLAQLTAEDRDELMQMIAQWLIAKRTGLF